VSELAERFRSQAQGSDNFTLGAFEGERLVGMVSFWRPAAVKFHHCGDITAMYVIPEARGRGIGRALLLEALSRARTLAGLEQVHLAVTSANTAARALYASVGFQNYGVLPRSFKLDDIYLDQDLMTLEFAAT
jgi:ribosomal protein S18 acetylase RimI-like enzyme